MFRYWRCLSLSVVAVILQQFYKAGYEWYFQECTWSLLGQDCTAPDVVVSPALRAVCVPLFMFALHRANTERAKNRNGLSMQLGSVNVFPFLPIFVFFFFASATGSGMFAYTIGAVSLSCLAVSGVKWAPDVATKH